MWWLLPSIRYPSAALKNERDVVVAACNQYGHALVYASDALKEDREVMVAAAQDYQYTLDNPGQSFFFCHSPRSPRTAGRVRRKRHRYTCA